MYQPLDHIGCLTLAVNVFKKKKKSLMCLTLVHLQSIFKSQMLVALKYIYLLGKRCFLRRASPRREEEERVALWSWIVDPD